MKACTLWVCQVRVESLSGKNNTHTHSLAHSLTQSHVIQRLNVAFVTSPHLDCLYYTQIKIILGSVITSQIKPKPFVVDSILNVLRHGLQTWLDNHFSSCTYTMDTFPKHLTQWALQTHTSAYQLTFGAKCTTTTKTQLMLP